MSKRTFSVAAAFVAAAGLTSAASALPAASHASVVIRHQVRGCHTWAVNGGTFRASQSVVLRRGGSITITNNDIMPHQLVKTSGPVVQVRSLKMARIGATATVTFARAGVYRFTTKAGEDYMSGMKTIGEDNVLRLTVKVS